MFPNAICKADVDDKDLLLPLNNIISRRIHSSINNKTKPTTTYKKQIALLQESFRSADENVQHVHYEASY